MVVIRLAYSLVTPAIAVCLYIVSVPAQAIVIEAGGGLSVVSARVSSTKTNTSENIATIASSSYTPYLSLLGDEAYFSDDSNWGWTYRVWAGRFEVNKQKIDGGFSTDFDTALTGQYVYAIPLVFYRFGDRVAREPVRNWHVTLGIGYGLSYSSMKGDVRLTDKSNDPDAQTVNVNATDVFLSYSLLAKVAYNNFFFSITDDVPQIRDKDNDSIFRINNLSFVLGYAFSFDFEFSDLLNIKY